MSPRTELLIRRVGGAVLHAAYIVNRIPTRALPDGKTPHEIFTGNTPSIAHLRIFGCKAFVHIPDEKRRKLDPKSLECIFLGYAEHRRAFRALHRPTNRIFESRDVRFDEGLGAAPNRVELEVEIHEKMPEEVVESEEERMEEMVEKSEEEEVEDLVDAKSESASSRKSYPNASVEDVPDEDDPLSDLTDLSDEEDDMIPSFLKQSPKRLPTPKAPKPYPIPPPNVRRSSRVRKPPMRDDDPSFKVSSYNRKPKENPPR